MPYENHRVTLLSMLIKILEPEISMYITKTIVSARKLFPVKQVLGI